MAGRHSLPGLRGQRKPSASLFPTVSTAIANPRQTQRPGQAQHNSAPRGSASTRQTHRSTTPPVPADTDADSLLANMLNQHFATPPRISSARGSPARARHPQSQSLLSASTGDLRDDDGTIVPMATSASTGNLDAYAAGFSRRWGGGSRASLTPTFQGNVKGTVGPTGQFHAPGMGRLKKQSFAMAIAHGKMEREPDLAVGLGDTVRLPTNDDLHRINRLDQALRQVRRRRRGVARRLLLSAVPTTRAAVARGLSLHGV